ncbi:type II secretion system protein [Peptoniphilus senegalensis]|uniref:Type II secretion system protein n=1 Tax=Peptoniphilus senegalensis TaxID=1465757 RepID=A0ABV1IY75_9FIRM|nr:hypothetical protein PEPTYR26121_00999 [Peptoniphilus tyrrelliae]
MKKLNLKFTCRRKGYSLIELVLSIAMLLIIAMVLTSILVISQKALNKTYKNQNINSDMSYAIDYIKDEIESSDYYTYIGGHIYFIKRVDNKYVYINYFEDENRLYRYASVEDELKKFDKLPRNGNNPMTEEIKDFKISDDSGYFSIYLKYNDLDKINIKVAKRIQIYE